MTTQYDLLPVDNSFPGLRIPVTLLRLLTISLSFCLTIIASAIIYWSLTDTLSNYRRQMNDAAFKAQYYVTQQDSLLKSISSSMVHITRSELEFSAQKNRPAYSQLRLLSLESHSSIYHSALVLTEREVIEIDNSNSKLIYLPPHDTLMRELNISDELRLNLSASNTFKGQWDQSAAHTLLNQHRGPNALWLSATNGSLKHIYLLRPVNNFDASEGWLGLEFNQFDQAFIPSKLHQGRYALYDASGSLVLHSSSWQVPEELSQFQASQDTFNVMWKHGLPTYVSLNKSVGSAGWRLVYYIPATQLLNDTLVPVYITILSATLLFIATFLGARYIRLHLVEPVASYHRALSESVSLNSRIIEIAPVGVCLIRCDKGSVIRSNESARQWLASVPQLREQILGARHDGIISMEHELPDGRFIQLTCVTTGYDDTAAILCCINDVTDFKLAEQSMLLAKNLSDQANDEKTLFLSTLSHEIRTPMYGILGSLEMLRTTQLDIQQNDYLEASQQASSALMRTINDSLDMTLIESGRLVLSHESFSPPDLVEEVAFNYSARARSKGLQLYIILDPNTPDKVKGDRGRIRQILNNLVSNAIKFTESGHVILRLHCEHMADDNWQLRFQVVDTGPGIAPEFQMSIFEPYYRVPGRISQNTSGTGLGLAICARLSDRMCGSLSVFSEQGLGSSFNLNLTFAHCYSAQKTVELFPDAKTIYVCGDVPEVVENLCHWLRRWGYMTAPYTRHNGTPSSKSVLVEAFFGVAKPVTWDGPRVIMHAAGTHPSHLPSNSWGVRIFSLNSLRDVVAQVQAGIVTETRFSPRSNLALKMNLKLLTVDDSPLALEVILQQTKYLGNDVVAIANPMDALAHIDLLSFDAVLTDLQMHHMDGLSFARALRERGFEGPIIGITGETSPALRTYCESAGIRPLLVKPVPLDALSEVLQTVKGKMT